MRQAPPISARKIAGFASSWLILLACSVGACGGSQPSPTTQDTTAVKAVAPPPAKVPSDANRLVPRDATFLAKAEVAAFAQAKSFAALRAMTERYGCVLGAEVDWFLQHTTRVLVAGRGPRNAPELLVLLEGKYTEADVSRALDLVEARIPHEGTPAVRATRVHGDRFTVTTSGPLSATLLEGRVLVIGHDALVAAALDLVVHTPPAPGFDDEVFRALRARVACDERSLCLLLSPGSAAANEARRNLNAVGLKRVGNAVEVARTAIAVDPRVGLALSVASEMASADEAATAVKEANDRLWQLGVFARLTGFPGILDQAHVRSENNRAMLDWQITDDEITRLQTRLRDVFDDGDISCKAPAQSRASNTTP